MTPGRNDPCPCGSGRKYKHCCLRAHEAVPPEEVTWRRVRRAIDDLGHRILNAAMAHFGPTGIHEAWAEFTLWEDEEAFDPETPHIQVFAPWFLYDWLPDPDETEVPPAAHAEGGHAARSGREALHRGVRPSAVQLTAEVNSAERAGKLRAIIEERLGDRARFRTAKIESARSMLERARASTQDPKANARRAGNERFAELPEVKAVLAERLRAHYRGWVDEKIPALGGRTPREAVRDPDGREAVEALIVDIERSGETMRPPLDPAIVRELRETLGLPARSP